MKKVLALAPAVIFFCGAILVTPAYANTDELTDWMMEEEQQTLDSSLQELEPLLTSSEEETATLTSSLQATEDQLATTNTDITTTETSIANLQDEIATLEEQATTESTTDYDAEIAALQTQLAEQEAQLTTLQSNADTLTQTIASTASELEAAIQEQAALMEQINLANSTYDTELTLVTSQISELSDNQIKALLRSMNTTDKNGIELQLDSEQLAIILDGDYSFQKTNLVLKAYTEEAKFLSKAEALRAEAEATGNEELLKVADMMEQRAEDQLNRFSDLAAGHPGRSEQKLADGEAEAAERKARGLAPKPAAQGDAGTHNQAGSSQSRSANNGSANAGNQNNGGGANAGGGNRGNGGGGQGRGNK
jgi:chromosome segregation ATPase